MGITCGDIDMKKFTKQEIRNKITDEYKKIYSRKYKRAHYRNKWEIMTDNHAAEEDFKLWCNESKIIMRKHKVGVISDEQMLDYIEKWKEQDEVIKSVIAKTTIPDN